MRPRLAGKFRDKLLAPYTLVLISTAYNWNTKFCRKYHFVIVYANLIASTNVISNQATAVYVTPYW